MNQQGIPLQAIPFIYFFPLTWPLTSVFFAAGLPPFFTAIFFGGLL
jgi:hypothetical protein